MQRDSDENAKRVLASSASLHRIDRGEIKAACIRECSEIRNRGRGLGDAEGEELGARRAKRTYFFPTRLRPLRPRLAPVS